MNWMGIWFLVFMVAVLSFECFLGLVVLLETPCTGICGGGSGRSGIGVGDRYLMVRHKDMSRKGDKND